MKLSNYSYDLPKSLIADMPVINRGESRLMILNRKDDLILDKKYYDMVDFLNPGDVLVLNDTKVIKARLNVSDETGSMRELVILEKHSFDDDWHKHRALYRGKLKIGDKLHIDNIIIEVDEILGGGIAIIKSGHDLLRVIEKYGHVPLPPYIHRNDKPLDIERYQTIWANDIGSVAAPTASLNMTNDILNKLNKKGVKIAYLTLHVGLGTFLPIRTDNLEDHHMHQEYFEIPNVTVDLIYSAKSSGSRIVALGTTVARALEYSHKDLMKKSSNISGEADIFIYPGYDFRIIDGLLTNYHAPKSTVLMLTAAFVGWDKLMRAYDHAIKTKYHFLSYGDSMLIL